MASECPVSGFVETAADASAAGDIDVGVAEGFVFVEGNSAGSVETPKWFVTRHVNTSIVEQPPIKRAAIILIETFWSAIRVPGTGRYVPADWFRLLHEVVDRLVAG